MSKYDELLKSATANLGPLYHQHLLVRAFVNNPPNSSQALESWLSELVAAIGMKVVAGPFSKYVEAVGNAGMTGGVLIETSHCAVHVWNECKPAMIQACIYSCSSFEADTVVKKLSEFGLVAYEKMVIDRNERFRVVDSSVSEEA